jgi:PPOX class probable F420-dependent enzyme
MSRRDQIGLTEDEVREYLGESRTIILVSLGPEGFPHPMPMWFAVDDDGAICMATYRSSQKIVNIQRDSRVSLLVESGERYAELKGLVIYGRAEIVDDFERVTDVLLAAAGAENNESTRDGVAKTAAKRYLIRVKPERVVSWDHAKLGGVY